MRYGALILSLFALTGCMSTSPDAWRHTGASGFVQASDYCKGRVNDEMWRAAAFGGAIVPLVALFARPGIYGDCMRAQGFQPAD